MVKVFVYIWWMKPREKLHKMKGKGNLKVLCAKWCTKCCAKCWTKCACHWSKSYVGNLIVHLERSTSKTVKWFAVEWFKVTSTKGLEYQWMLFPKKLMNLIWRDVLLDLKDLENAQNTMHNLSKGWQYVFKKVPFTSRKPRIYDWCLRLVFSRRRHFTTILLLVA